jgi:hypothetical protein
MTISPPSPEAAFCNPPTDEMPLVAMVDMAWTSATKARSPPAISEIHSTSVRPV